MRSPHTTITMILLAVLLVLSHCKANLIYPMPTVHNGAASTTIPEPTSPATTSGVQFMDENVLFPRQDASPVTCGYEEADPKRAVLCAAGSGCAWDYGAATSSSSTFWGPYCCPTTASGCPSFAKTRCIDYSSAYLQPSHLTVISRILYW
jgi:hypothetical protein